MNEQQMQALLDTWYREREIPRPKVQTSVASVMANVTQTRQRGRWWPFPVFRRKAQTATATDTAEYQPSPIPATNGHAPTVIGRTQTMFSPVKAITAGALVFAIGGVMLIAQPFDQQGSVPGAAVPGMQSTELPGVEVTVTQICDFGVSPPVCTWTASDPRLTGTATIESWNDIGIPGEDSTDGFTWFENTFEGPEGRWSGHVYVFWGEPTQNFLVMSGADNDEGWHYLASSIVPTSEGDFDWTGVLYEGELPPSPEALAE
jgi:hypothetical protein